MKQFQEQKLLINNKVIHFIGIGGIGMSGIANLLYSLGFIVQGSDIAVNSNIERLQELGINIYIGHNEANLVNADIVVISSAIKENNVEYIEANAKKLPIYKRGRVLGEIMGFYYGIAVTGAHGKTTTTSLIGGMLLHAGLEPTVVVGGVVNDWQSNLKLGQGNFFVAEADESDGSFLNLPSVISVITNIESEHIDYYKTKDNLYEHFIRFINKVPFFGKAIVCIDNDGVKEVMKLVENTNISTYGVSEEADYRAFDIKITPNGTEFSIFIKAKNQSIADIKSNLYGVHNVLNAVAAFAVIDSLDLNSRHALKFLSSFKGVNRRFTSVGSYNGATIFDDYAHHPSEVKAVLVSARNIVNKNNKIITILQPHRYSRLKDYFNDFVEVLFLSDIVIVIPVYSARESFNGFDNNKLVSELKNKGHNNVFSAGDNKELISILKPCINEGDMIINMGAGDITVLAKNLQFLLDNHK